MSAPLTPSGLAALIVVTWAVIGIVTLLAVCRAAADADRAAKAAAPPPVAPLTDEQETVLAQLDRQFEE